MGRTQQRKQLGAAAALRRASCNAISQGPSSLLPADSHRIWHPHSMRCWGAASASMHLGGRRLLGQAIQGVQVSQRGLPRSALLPTGESAKGEVASKLGGQQPGGDASLTHGQRDDGAWKAVKC